MILLLLCLSFYSLGFDNIFANDDRIRIKSKRDFNYPYSAIGFISGRTVSSCTGSFIGENTFLTASHCVPVSSAKRLPKIYTKKRKSKYDKVFEILSIERGDYHLSKNIEDDWAIITTKQKFKGKFFELASHAPDFDTSLSLAGFSSDLKGYLGVHQSCSFKMDHLELNGIFYHDCDSTRGASGAPLYSCTDSSCLIYGIHQGSFRDGKEHSLTRQRFTAKFGNKAVKVESISAL